VNTCARERQRENAVLRVDRLPLNGRRANALDFKRTSRRGPRLSPPTRARAPRAYGRLEPPAAATPSIAREKSSAAGPMSAARDANGRMIFLFRGVCRRLERPRAPVRTRAPRRTAHKWLDGGQAGPLPRRDRFRPRTRGLRTCHAAARHFDFRRTFAATVVPSTARRRDGQSVSQSSCADVEGVVAVLRRRNESRGPRSPWRGCQTRVLMI
jgi:hypothetical protein